MSRRWYWAAEVDLAAGRVRLDPEETAHLLKVTRHRAGDVIEAIDGRGGRYTVELRGRSIAGGGRALEAEILTVHPPAPAPPPLVLAAPLIPWPRLEALVDGAIQLGVTQLCIWEAERARPAGPWSPLRSARLLRIARAATAQSLGSYALEIQGPRPLADLLRTWSGMPVWVAHGPAPAGEPAEPGSPLPPGVGRGLVIGPEGGLTDSEVELCLAAGARCLTLGPRRLRTEVAAIAGLAALNAGEPGWRR
ncbi:MAG TPA: RsmE family RNA methyltransferase [Candidatus Udaeobacter sp.]|nr:RsmE family RNA methyltransferase [Candidatus Udaeobacter sp.]